MEERFFIWVERFGFPTVMTFILMYVVYQIFKRWQDSAAMVSANQESHSAHIARLSKESIQAIKEFSVEIRELSTSMRQNTSETGKLTAMLEKSIGSGPVCKIDDNNCKFNCDKIINEMRGAGLGVGLTHEQMEFVIKQHLSKREKQPVE